MSLQTQAVLKGRLPIEDICRRLRTVYGACDVVARATRNSDYWIVEFQDVNGMPRSLDLFLNSWAKDDYPELPAGDSTLLSTEFSDTSLQIIRASATGSSGWFRRHDSEAWTPLG